MATGFFVIFSLIAGVVGMATSLTGLTQLTHSGRHFSLNLVTHSSSHGVYIFLLFSGSLFIIIIFLMT